MDDLRKAAIELLKSAPDHIQGHWPELDEVCKALSQPEQEPVVIDPTKDQIKQITDGLEHCFSDESKREFLRVWIRDWTLHKLSKHTAPPSKQEPVANEVQLNIIRWWPDEFAERLDLVWKDLVGFIPNYKLHDLQLLLAEYGFTMKVYEGEAPPSKPWVSLTDEDIKEGAKYSWVDFQAFQSVAWWADELLKEKNT